MIIRTVLAVSFVALAGVAGFSSGGYASEQKTYTRTVYDMSDAPKLAEQVKAVCDDKSVKLSDKAKKACETQSFPSITKALKFRNAGIGAEFNTLITQRN